MSGRHVAVVFPLPIEPVHLGKDVFLIPEGLRRLGFEVELHCPSARGGGEWPVPVVTGPVGDASYWRERDLDAAIVFSFLHNARLLEAVQASGARVVAKADSDGAVVARAHPRETLRYAWFDSPQLSKRAVALAYWLGRVGPLHRRELSSVVAAVDTADATVVETEPAREAVARVVGAERLVTIPNPVGDAFTSVPVPAEREKLIVAIGRWDLPVKDAPLLAAALRRFLSERPDHRAVVIGREGERTFGGLDRVEYHGQLPQEEIVPLLGRARTFVSSSRWESFCLAAHEALAMGCSAVGPKLPPFVDIASRGPYGTVATARDAAGLAAALAAESDASRDPRSTAVFWRERLQVEAVARRFAELLA